jgi:hypothetical protein
VCTLLCNSLLLCNFEQLRSLALVRSEGRLERGKRQLVIPSHCKNVRPVSPEGIKQVQAAMCKDTGSRHSHTSSSEFEPSHMHQERQAQQEKAGPQGAGQCTACKEVEGQAGLLTGTAAPTDGGTHMLWRPAVIGYPDQGSGGHAASAGNRCGHRCHMPR